jgi:excisionase family DNA binding protein
MDKDILLTPAQVSEYLQIDQCKITRWLRDAYLRGYKIGREWRIAPEDLEIFMEAHANVPRTNLGQHR